MCDSIQLAPNFKGQENFTRDPSEYTPSGTSLKIRWGNFRVIAHYLIRQGNLLELSSLIWASLG